MNYIVWVSPHAQRSLGKLHGQVFERVQEAIDGLVEDPRPPGCIKMKGRTNQWRLRAGCESLKSVIDGMSTTVSEGSHETER